MNQRRNVKQRHERAIVDDFLVWLNARRRSAYVVVATPDSPDAIIRAKTVTRWIEVVDAFWRDEWARDVYSHATPGEKHAPITRGPYLEPDRQFAERFVAAVSSKLVKSSYRAITKEFGPGYLLVGVQHPWFDRNTIARMTERWNEGQPWPNRGSFSSVFLAYSSMGRRQFQPWKI